MTKMVFAIPALLGLGLAAGCASERHEAIPASAQVVSEAQGDIKYTAPQDGEVFVYNQSEGELIYSGRIREGETLSIEPLDDEDKIRIDSQVVSTRDLKEGDRHKIFFQPARGRDFDRQGGRDRDRADLATDRDARVVEERTTIIRGADEEPQKKVVTETEIRTNDGDKVIVEEKTTTKTQD